MSAKLEFHGISRAFPGVQALDRVSFDLQAGEVHALVGENGAGKSTLIRILAGADQATSGSMTLEGRPFQPKSPREALQQGIATIYQEKNWLPLRNALFNLWLGREPAGRGARLKFKEMREQSRKLLASLQAGNLPLELPAERLSAGRRQILEIARALARESSLLVMDEPTSALNPPEQEALFAIVDNLRRQGLTILYVSHRLEEIFRLAGRVTVLRDGRHVATAAIGDTDRDALIRAMIGRDWSGAFPPRRSELGEVLLEVEGLSSPGAFQDVSFTLRQGEVLGVTGLSGSGKEELGLALFGAWPVRAGRVSVNGRPLKLSPGEAIRRGLGYLPADRKTEGIIPELSVRRNIALPVLKRLAGSFGRLSRSREEQLARGWVERLKIKTPGLGELCSNLSGGNQQKVALAKGLAAEARVLILAEPTQEVDVAVKFEIYRLIAELSGQGVGIILVSGELNEMVGLCHSVLVLREGRAAAFLDGRTADRETILRYALGQTAPPPK